MTIESKIKSLKAKRANIIKRIGEHKRATAAKFLNQLSETPKANVDAISYAAASYMATLRNVVKPLKDEAALYESAIKLLR